VVKKFDRMNYTQRVNNNNNKMKTFKNLYYAALLFSGIVSAQIGIGTVTPDASAVLDLSSTNKGLLIPRITTAEQSALVNPAIGLIIFNTTTHQIETNKGDGFGAVLWTGASTIGTTAAIGTNTSQLATTEFVLANTDGYASVNVATETTTTATSDELISGMSLKPSTGIYSVSFNSQIINAAITTTTTVNSTIGTAQGVLDLQAAYNQLIAMPATNSNHVPAMGGGETLLPGVYLFPAAASIAAVLNLDAQGNPDAVFIFKIGGAFTVGAVSSIVLKNGALARNVFFVSEGAISVGATCTMKGTYIAHAGALAFNAGSSLEGRFFTIAGAITFGPATAIVPTGASPINLGVLSNFAIFTSAGAITNAAISNIKGNIGTNLGAISGLEISIVDGSVYTPDTIVIYTPPITTTTTAVGTSNVLATFSIYQNGVLVPNSSRTIVSNASITSICLQAMATILEGQAIDVRWRIDSGKVALGNRILTLIKVR
jgi:hypothetical protein